MTHRKRINGAANSILIDSAEKAAREKRQQKIDKLFKEDLW